MWQMEVRKILLETKEYMWHIFCTTKIFLKKIIGKCEGFISNFCDKFYKLDNRFLKIYDTKSLGCLFIILLWTATLFPCALVNHNKYELQSYFNPLVKVYICTSFVMPSNHMAEPSTKEWRKRLNVMMFCSHHLFIDMVVTVLIYKSNTNSCWLLKAQLCIGKMGTACVNLF